MEVFLFRLESKKERVVMELVNYISSLVHIELSNGFYYRGRVVEADNNSITIIDLKEKRVSISKDNIMTIKEISHGN